MSKARAERRRRARFSVPRATLEADAHHAASDAGCTCERELVFQHDPKTPQISYCHVLHDDDCPLVAAPYEERPKEYLVYIEAPHD